MKFNLPMPVRLVLAFLGPALVAGAGDNGDWSTLSLGQIVSMLIAGTMRAGALLAPSGKVAPNDKAVALVQDIVTKTAEAHEKLTTQAVESIQRVKDAVGDLGALLLPPPPSLPAEVWQRPLGPLAQQVIDSVQRLGQ